MTICTCTILHCGYNDDVEKVMDEEGSWMIIVYFIV